MITLKRTAPIFRPSFGNLPDRIVGRDDVLDQLMEAFDSYPGSRERAILIKGQRGMGKTALLIEAAQLAQSHNFVAVRTTCGLEMLDNILDGLRINGAQFMEGKKPPVKGFSAGALGFSMGLTFSEEAERTLGFRAKLGLMCDKLAEVSKGVLLLVDEVQPGSDALRQLTTSYQELAGDGKDIAIVMAHMTDDVVKRQK